MKKRKEEIDHYEAVFDPNGSGYTVTVPKLPGLVTEGSNLNGGSGNGKGCYPLPFKIIFIDGAA